MSTNKRWLAAYLVAISGCATDATDPDDNPSYDADPSDFDSKADGIASTSPEVLKLIDNAKTRLFAQLPNITDKTLLTHLKSAAARGVDVQVYVVVPKPGHPVTVLASEQLEAAGVDITVVRKSALPGFLAIGDDALLNGTTTVTTASVVKAAADKFAAAVAEDTSGNPPALGTDDTALMLMPDSGPGPIVSLIAGAKTSIDLEIYQLQSPAVVGALLDAQHRGVSVRVMLEPKTVGAQNYKPVSVRLAQGGITVKATPPAFDSGHNVDHAKFMVLDGAELVFGSGNMVRSGLGGNPALEFDNRDFWVRDRRAGSVSEAKSLFDADWNRTATTSKKFDALVLTPDNADQRVLDLIGGAKKRLDLYNQSLDDQPTLDALLAAKARGVDVHVLLGDQPGFGGAPPANQPAIDALAAKGIPAAFFTAHYLHGKVIVADGAAFVGSQNFTKGGLINNREVGEILTGAPIVDALAKTFAADEANPTP